MLGRAPFSSGRAGRARDVHSEFAGRAIHIPDLIFLLLFHQLHVDFVTGTCFTAVPNSWNTSKISVGKSEKT